MKKSTKYYIVAGYIVAKKESGKEIKDYCFEEGKWEKDFEEEKKEWGKAPGWPAKLVETDFILYGVERSIVADDLPESLKEGTPYLDGFFESIQRDTGDVDEKYFIPEEKLYYTYPDVTHSDETLGKLPKEKRQTWQYLKGAKKLPRKAANGHEYLFSEGAIPLIDAEDKPARTMLTSEGSFSRTTHIVKDHKTGRIRLLTAEETERIQGFPTGHTQYCDVNGEVVEMPTNKRRFMMGNALVVNLSRDMEKTLDEIIENEE